MSLRLLHSLLWSRLAWTGILLLGGLVVAQVSGRIDNPTTSAIFRAGQELIFIRPVEAGSSRHALQRAAMARRQAAARRRMLAARKRAAEARRRAAAARNRAIAARKRAAAARKRADAARKRAAAARKRSAAAKKNQTARSAAKKSAASASRPAVARTSQTKAPEPATTEASSDPQTRSDQPRQSRRKAQRAEAALPAPEVPQTLVGVFQRFAKQPTKPAALNRGTRAAKRRHVSQSQPVKIASRHAARASRLQQRAGHVGRGNSLGRQQRTASAGASELPWARSKQLRRPAGTSRKSVAPVQNARQLARRRALSEARLERQRRAAARRLSNFQALPAHSFGSNRDTVRNEILVERLNPALLKRAAALGFKPVGGTSNGGANVVRLRTPSGSNTQTAFKMLSNLFATGSVHFNRRYRVYRAAQADGWHTTLQSKEKYKCSSERCYGPAVVRWRNHLSRCTQGLRVGVVDTAIETRHPAFAGQKITTTRVASGLAPRHNDGHGTGILALLAGSPNSSTPGLIPDASFYAADIFFRDAHGNPTSDSLTLHKALLTMEAWNVQVINLSLAGPPDSLVEKTIQRLSRKGVMFVAAGGNEGPSAGPSYPAAYPEVIAVTAIDRSLRGYRYANRGDYIDVAAPGVNIWTAAPNDKDALLSGTSLAAPFVTSIVSAVYRALPDKSRQGLLDAIATQDLGHPGKDHIYGRGLVRAPGSCRPRLRTSPQIARANRRNLSAIVFKNMTND